MKKLLFLIHDLDQGGAEKVLVNLVNNMDAAKFNITVIVLFGGGVNEQFLAPYIRLIVCHKKAFRGNSHVMKLFSPRQLYRHYIKEHYDIVISYLEGPSARIISGCDDPSIKKISWIHCTMHSANDISKGFRSFSEARRSYVKMDRLVFVSSGVREKFLMNCPYTGQTEVLYNTNESENILQKSKDESAILPECFNWCGIGKVSENKGFDRMIRIQSRLIHEGYNVHLHILGDGPLKPELEELAVSEGVSGTVSFHGYQTNPYKYISRSDLFVCASHSEGFSTAATEALIVGTPVVTTLVSGMKEMLGENDEWGVITENNEDALYEGIKGLLDDPAMLAHYKEKAIERGKSFSTEATVKAVEDMLLSL
ncbi:MAG: glycosyltransferase [Clostridia bacterium]|nr:glycosyltransferase [Clostridia bacterium]